MKTALIVVDFQNDFVTGSMAVGKAPAKQDPTAGIPIINQLVEMPFDCIVFTLDWHPKDHISFFDNAHLRQLAPNSPKPELTKEVHFVQPRPITQILWPAHCVQGSKGAEISPLIKVPNRANIVHKGTRSDIDSYSGFYDNEKLHQTELDDILRKAGITHVFICGLCFDICVGSTTQDALSLGYKTALIEDATFSLEDDRTVHVRRELTSKKCVFLPKYTQVSDVLSGKVVPQNWS